MTRRNKPTDVLAAMAVRPTPPRVVRKVLDGLRRNPRQLYNTNRRAALLRKQTRAALMFELGDNPPASAQVLIDVIADQVCMFHDVSAVRAALGPAVVNRKKRSVYPIVAECRALADSLSQHMARFTELKVAHSLDVDIRKLKEAGGVVSE